MKDWAIEWRSPRLNGIPAHLVVQDKPLWAMAISRLAEVVESKVFRHELCNPANWLFRIGVGRDKEHSLGTALYGACNWCFFIDERHVRHGYKVALSAEWLVANGLEDPFEGAA